MNTGTVCNGDLKMDVDQDNWGCVEPSQLFTSTGKTQSLRFLVEQLAKNDVHANGTASEQQGTSQYQHWNKTKYGEHASSSQTGINGASHSSTSLTNGFSKKSMPKTILKQKRGFVQDKTPNLKRVTFEVERFVIDNLQAGSEKESAEAQLAIRLGAKAPKSKPINYKQLKEMRQHQKVTQDSSSTAELLRSLNSQSKKLKKRNQKNVLAKGIATKHMRNAKKSSQK